MRNQFIILVLLSACLLLGCGKHSNNNPAPANDPGQATLTFPLQNSSCTTGTVLSNTQSSITFNWLASANTESYEIDIKNLLTNTTTSQTATNNQLTVSLSRNTPYSWYVVSKSSQSTKTAQSAVWKFYNSGLGATSHPPFPADLTAPGLAQNVTATSNAINLTWGGSDADNDITDYDVYFGTAATPPLLKSGVTDMFLNNVSVTSVTTYYWKIVTKDSQGNTSDSDIYQFKVN
jgi:hypothetical protein